MLELLSVLLIVTTFEPPQLPMQHLIGPVVARTAARMELLDERELVYFKMATPEEFKSDLERIRVRYQDLFDAPPLQDAARFPDRDTINELMAFNRSYRAYAEACQLWGSADYFRWRVVIQEIDQCYKAWDLARDSKCVYYYITARRYALKNLRDLLGPEAYYNGDMPSCVPFHRFRSVN
jgi:hypothetical protein